MTKNQKVWCWKDGKKYRVRGFRFAMIGDRQVLKVIIGRFFTKREVFHDEVMDL